MEDFDLFLIVFKFYKLKNLHIYPMGYYIYILFGIIFIFYVIWMCVLYYFFRISLNTYLFMFYYFGYILR